jgi:hypothetical protein
MKRMKEMRSDHSMPLVGHHLTGENFHTFYTCVPFMSFKLFMVNLGTPVRLGISSGGLLRIL